MNVSNDATVISNYIIYAVVEPNVYYDVILNR